MIRGARQLAFRGATATTTQTVAVATLANTSSCAKAVVSALSAPVTKEEAGGTGITSNQRLCYLSSRYQSTDPVLAQMEKLLSGINRNQEEEPEKTPPMLMDEQELFEPRKPMTDEEYQEMRDQLDKLSREGPGLEPTQLIMRPQMRRKPKEFVTKRLVQRAPKDEELMSPEADRVDADDDIDVHEDDLPEVKEYRTALDDMFAEDVSEDHDAKVLLKMYWNEISRYHYPTWRFSKPIQCHPLLRAATHRLLKSRETIGKFNKSWFRAFTQSAARSRDYEILPLIEQEAKIAGVDLTSFNYFGPILYSMAQCKDPRYEEWVVRAKETLGEQRMKTNRYIVYASIINAELNGREQEAETLVKEAINNKMFKLYTDTHTLENYDAWKVSTGLKHANTDPSEPPKKWYESPVVADVLYMPTIVPPIVNPILRLATADYRQSLTESSSSSTASTTPSDASTESSSGTGAKLRLPFGRLTVVFKRRYFDVPDFPDGPPSIEVQQHRGIAPQQRAMITEVAQAAATYVTRRRNADGVPDLGMYHLLHSKNRVYTIGPRIKRHELVHDQFSLDKPRIGEDEDEDVKRNI